MPGTATTTTGTGCEWSFRKVVDQINYHCLDLESGGGGSFRGARGVPGRGGRGPPARRSDSVVEVSRLTPAIVIQVPISCDSQRAASHRQLARPEGPHEGGGRRLLLRRLQGRLWRGGVLEARGHEVRGQKAGRYQVPKSRGRDRLCASERGLR